MSDNSWRDVSIAAAQSHIKNVWVSIFWKHRLVVILPLPPNHCFQIRTVHLSFGFLHLTILIIIISPRPRYWNRCLRLQPFLCVFVDNLLGFRLLMTWKQFYNVVVAASVVSYSVPIFLIGLIPITALITLFQVCTFALLALFSTACVENVW